MSTKTCKDRYLCNQKLPAAQRLLWGTPAGAQGHRWASQVRLTHRKAEG